MFLVMYLFASLSLRIRSVDHRRLSVTAYYISIRVKVLIDRPRFNVMNVLSHQDHLALKNVNLVPLRLIAFAYSDGRPSALSNPLVPCIQLEGAYRTKCHDVSQLGHLIR